MQSPVEAAEQIQVLRYEEGEQFLAHTDYFDPALCVGNAGCQQMIWNGTRNRKLTFFLYLNDVEAGGETNFPLARGGKVNYSDLSCGEGFSASPIAYTGIVFYNMGPAGDLDPQSMHRGCAPGPGSTKWAATMAVWNAVSPYYHPFQRDLDT